MARDAVTGQIQYINTSGTYDPARNASELGASGLPIYEQMGFGSGESTNIGSSQPVIGGSNITLAPVVNKANEVIKQFAPVLTILIGMATLIVLIVYRRK